MAGRSREPLPESSSYGATRLQARSECVLISSPRTGEPSISGPELPALSQKVRHPRRPKVSTFATSRRPLSVAVYSFGKAQSGQILGTAALEAASPCCRPVRLSGSPSLAGSLRTVGLIGWQDGRLAPLRRSQHERRGSDWRYGAASDHADATFGHVCLLHLESSGFEHTPRFQGIDDLGREVLSFIPGVAPSALGAYPCITTG